MPAAERHGHSARRDLGWVVAAAAVAYVAGVVLELRERVTGVLAGFERWQLDELPFTLAVLACGLAWYAFRRLRESRSALHLHALAEARASLLLAHNRELSQRLIALQESERRALARELHDDLGQGCTAIRVEMACLRQAPGDVTAVLAAAERADAAAQSLYRSVHGLLRRLRPVHLETLGLDVALQELCAAWQSRSGVECRCHCAGPGGWVDSIDDRHAITVYRVAQEALTNVMRHAAARQVEVGLTRSAAGLSLVVEDDGRGPGPATASTCGLGLLGAGERAAALGGTLDVTARPGGGTRLVLSLPLENAGAASEPHTGCEPLPRDGNLAARMPLPA